MSKNEKTTYQNLQKIAKAVLRGKVIAVNKEGRKGGREAESGMISLQAKKN